MNPILLAMDADPEVPQDMFEGISDVFMAGAAGLGIVAAVIGIVLLVATVVFAMRGVTPLAVICGCATLTLLLGPVLMLIIAIIILVVMAVKGDPAIGAQAFGGWLLGTIIMVVMGLALVALGVATA